jgi:hypothetical protein
MWEGEAIDHATAAAPPFVLASCVNFNGGAPSFDPTARMAFNSEYFRLQLKSPICRTSH